MQKQSILYRKILIYLIPLLILSSFFCIYPSAAVYAQDFPRIIPDPAIEELSEKASFNWSEFSEAALLVSGTEKQELSPFLEQIWLLGEKLEKRLEEKQLIESGGESGKERGEGSNGGSFTEYEKGEEILAFLHDTLFRSYRERQTRLDVLLKTGIFNCASSAVLYIILAKRIGLSTRGIATKDHIFCAVGTEEGFVDVETTNPYGFEPGKKKDFEDSFGNVTGYSYVPPGNYSDRSPITDTQVLGILLQNRMSLLEKQDKFAEAVPLGVDRYALLQSERAEGIMRGEFINYAALLNRRKNYTEGLSFLDTVRETWGENEDYHGVLEVLVHNRITILLKDKEFEKAKADIEYRYSRGDIGPDLQKTLSSMVTVSRVHDLVYRIEPEAALREVNSLYRKGRISPETYEKYGVYLYGKMAETAGKSGDWVRGLEYIEKGLELFSHNTKLLNARKAFKSNVVISAHNRAAELVEEQEYGAAIAALKKALEIVPGNSTLLKDISLIQEMIDRTEEN